METSCIKLSSKTKMNKRMKTAVICNNNKPLQRFMNVKLMINANDECIYKCGACDCIVPTISLLHRHLETYENSTSYVFNHKTKTAYPKIEACSIAVQTDTSMFYRGSMLESILKSDNINPIPGSLKKIQTSVKTKQIVECENESVSPVARTSSHPKLKQPKMKDLRIVLTDCVAHTKPRRSSVKGLLGSYNPKQEGVVKEKNDGCIMETDDGHESDIDVEKLDESFKDCSHGTSVLNENYHKKAVISEQKQKNRIKKLKKMGKEERLKRIAETDDGHESDIDVEKLDESFQACSDGTSVLNENCYKKAVISGQKQTDRIKKLTKMGKEEILKRIAEIEEKNDAVVNASDSILSNMQSFKANDKEHKLKKDITITEDAVEHSSESILNNIKNEGKEVDPDNVKHEHSYVSSWDWRTEPKTTKIEHNVYTAERRRLKNLGRRREKRKKRKATNTTVMNRNNVSTEKNLNRDFELNEDVDELDNGQTESETVNIELSEVEVEVKEGNENSGDVTLMNGDKMEEENMLNENVLVHCEYCGESLEQKKLKRHRETFHKEKSLICETCGKVYTTLQGLRCHLTRHKGDLACSLCPKKFGRESHLKSHLASHTGYKPFACEVCGKGFIHRKEARKHMANIHMGIKKYQCDICGKAFHQKSGYNTHMSTHFEPTLPCQICGRKFKDKCTLSRHEYTHSAEKRYECHFCDRGFINTNCFYQHMTKQHNVDRDSLKKQIKILIEYNRRMGTTLRTFRIPENFEDICAEMKTAEESFIAISSEKSANKMQGIKKQKHDNGTNLSSLKEPPTTKKSTSSTLLNNSSAKAVETLLSPTFDALQDNMIISNDSNGGVQMLVETPEDNLQGTLTLPADVSNSENSLIYVQDFENGEGHFIRLVNFENGGQLVDQISTETSEYVVV